MNTWILVVCLGLSSQCSTTPNLYFPSQQECETFRIFGEAFAEHILGHEQNAKMPSHCELLKEDT